MMGSANELHLDAFREHPEFASFRGRLELIRTPYLRSAIQEQKIYDTHVIPHIRRHVSPHASEIAAQFAVLTRMRKPNTDKYSRALSNALSGLTATEKMDLYANSKVPERLESDAQKVLRAGIREVFEESDAYPIYEGRIGASPREIRGVLLDAAQSTQYRCLSPLAVLDELEQLSQRKSEFEWLQQDMQAGGYHDVKLFRETLLSRLLTVWEQELYASSGLVDDQQYDDLFEKYVQHVSVWTKKERIRNRHTGEYEEPDENMMRELERLLDMKGGAEDARKQMISAIAAWAIDHPGEKVEGKIVFPQYLRRLRDAIFSDKRTGVAKIARDIVALGHDARVLAPTRSARRTHARRSTASLRSSAIATPAASTSPACYCGSVITTSSSLESEVRRLAVPAIFHSLLQTLVFVVDRVMLGRHSDASLAAMQIGGAFEWSIWSVFAAFEVGTIARIGRARRGRGLRCRAPGRAGFSIVTAVLLGFAFLAALTPAVLAIDSVRLGQDVACGSRRGARLSRHDDRCVAARVPRRPRRSRSCKPAAIRRNAADDRHWCRTSCILH